MLGEIYMENKTTDIEFHLSNGRIIPGNIDKENVLKNVDILKRDLNDLYILLQDIIASTDHNREKIQNYAISKGSEYLAGMGIPLVDYYHLNDGDYRLSTTLIMDSIIVINTLIGAIKDEHND
jgi:hypothetical protein